MNTAQNKYLRTAGILTAIASLMHIGIVIGGPDWYRFFGAGEMMAMQAEAGMIEPIITTLFIAFILGIWSLYAFSGAGMIFKMPITAIALTVIGSIFLLRGLLGIPLILTFNHPYLNELQEKMIFMVISSLICLLLGYLYLKGAYCKKKSINE
ncbi:hypothetical protein A33Q_1249 [Indibacter alkaliphilus LW1]|uniref:Uncharacterized protein n=1 Tax=Indibacter alkaliphilus (strain CCUG 57479 / KCTC 22604 / LW1) TaxID=1189612 RepID=S2DN23_INDAL|nr:hypothetical protein [Indibacter alkaliphilus]EOZ98595.1 hypothetical protein A33Q_1249 [Indibacter alkaliphilus LW1]